MDSVASPYSDREEDSSIRPASLEEFIGQESVVSNLKIYAKAARLREEPIDHALFSGPPGLGKTTLAKILSELRESSFVQLAAPNLRRPGDMVKILSGLQNNDVLFIDELHRLPTPVEEVLYSAMEDKTIDIVLSDSMAASSVTLQLPPFTLVGATTRPGALSAPLRDRFGIQLRLNYYEDKELFLLLQRAARIWNMQADEETLREIAKRSRGTPRIALRYLRRIWDYALAENSKGHLRLQHALQGFTGMHIDELGLSFLDIEFLKAVAIHYRGGPVGLKPIAAMLSEDSITLEDFVEPYLVRLGFILRTPRGRVLSETAYAHLGMVPRKGLTQFLDFEQSDSGEEEDK